VALIAYRTVNIYDFFKKTKFESNFETMDLIFLPAIWGLPTACEYEGVGNLRENRRDFRFRSSTRFSLFT